MNKKVVLITGASSGIGASTAEVFASNGYDVIINYANNKENALKEKELVENKYNVECTIIKADISNEEEVNKMYKEVTSKYDHIDALINNAGICKDTLLEDKTKEDFMRILEVNVYGTFYMSKLFGKLMFDRKQGSIVNVASTNAIDSYYVFSLEYDASKAAIINLNHNLANYFAPYVRVNAVCPGWVNTRMNKELSEEFKKEEINKTLLHRFAEPEEIAALIYFLCTDNASYINDSIIKIDGGRKC